MDIMSKGITMVTRADGSREQSPTFLVEACLAVGLTT